MFQKLLCAEYWPSSVATSQARSKGRESAEAATIKCATDPALPLDTHSNGEAKVMASSEVLDCSCNSFNWIEGERIPCINWL